MKLLKSTFLPTVTLFASCCIMKHASASHASLQTFIVKEVSPTTHGRNSVTPIHSNSTIIKTDRRLQSFKNANGLSSDGEWMPLGNELRGKATRDNYGMSIAISRGGNFVIIGGPKNDEKRKNAGHAQIFEYKDDTMRWEQVGQDIFGEKKEDLFGCPVDINNSGDVVVIGANKGDGRNGANSGRARVFRLIDGLWVKQGQVLVGKGEGDEFGFSVAISGDGKKVIIGGPKHDANGNNSGYAQIFEYRKVNQIWKQVAGDILGDEAEDYSGHAVDINDKGDVVIVGAWGGDGDDTDNSGHARVYQLIDGQWVQQGQDLNGKVSGNHFGESVAILGNGKKVIIGGGAGDSSGHAQVFEYKDDTQIWEQVGGDIGGEETGDWFGCSVAMNDTGDVVIVGARLNDGNGNNSGHARVFRLIDGQWEQQGQDLDGKMNSDEFGRSVAISGDGKKIIIGSALNDDNGLNSGHVRAFVFKTNRHNCFSGNSTTNVALEQSTSQSSTFENNATQWGSSIAVDGEKRSEAELGSNIGAMSTDQEIEPWWQVMLDKKHLISHIIIYNRDRSNLQYAWVSKRLQGYRVEIFNGDDADAVWTYDDPTPSGQDPGLEIRINITDCDIVGDRIKISIPGRTRHLHFREAEVYGVLSPEPSLQPTITAVPSESPSISSSEPSLQPTSLSAVPSLKPSSLLSHEPSLSPSSSLSSSSSEPTHDLAICDDSPLLILIQRKYLKPCTSISKEPEKFCNMERVQSHCPNTCGVCNTYRSSDSDGSFIFDEHVRSCQKWFVGMFSNGEDDLISTLCRRDDIYATCRKTCSFFVQKCDAA